MKKLVYLFLLLSVLTSCRLIHYFDLEEEGVTEDSGTNYLINLPPASAPLSLKMQDLR